MRILERLKQQIIYPAPITAPESEAIKKLLIVRCDALGDGVLSLPTLASLKQQRPDIEVYVLTSDVIGDIFNLTNYANTIIIDPDILLRQTIILPRHLIRLPQILRKLIKWYHAYRRLLAEIKSHNFDAAITFVTQKRVNSLIKAAKIPRVIGHYKELRGLIWSWRVPGQARSINTDINEYDRVLGTLQWLGLNSTYVKPRINLDGISPPVIIQDWLSSGYAYIAVQPLKSNDTGLSWPVQNFVELTKQLLNEGHRVILIGVKNEESTIREAYHELLHNSHLRTEFSMSIAELCVLIKKASLFVGNSSGPLHLASLVETPHVGINQLNFRYPFQKWKPLPQADQPNIDDYILFPKLDYQCGKCSPRHCPHYSCLRYIEPLEVMQAIKQQLQRISRYNP